MRLIIIKEFKDFSFLNGGDKDLDICLIAHPDFAPNLGLRYYLMGQQQVQKSLPLHQVSLGIACHNYAGFALETIAKKVERIYFLKISPYWSKIESACQQAGIVLLDQEELSCLL